MSYKIVFYTGVFILFPEGRPFVFRAVNMLFVHLQVFFLKHSGLNLNFAGARWTEGCRFQMVRSSFQEWKSINAWKAAYADLGRYGRTRADYISICGNLECWKCSASSRFVPLDAK
jgi:hypothetical protein